MRLTACLIVRNEERYLDACLSCFSGLADEIVVVDTGSSDRSREISRSYGAIVIDDLWRDDFSFSRNVALNRASGDWILYIDADELLEARIDELDCLDDPRAVAATVTFRASTKLTTYKEYRLFRNRPDIRFRGVIHETVLPDIQKIIAAENARVIHTPFSIEHRGYEGDSSHKHQRNHSMLIKAVQDDPERVYLWHALGECELGLGKFEKAEKAWRQALAVVHGRKPRPADALVYSDLIGLHFAENAIRLNDLDELFEEAGQLHGTDPLLMWWRARYLMSDGEISKARGLLLQLLSTGADDSKDLILSYDRRIFGAWSWALLGSCDMAEEDFAEAVSHFERALAGDTDSAEIGVKLSLARACVQRQDLAAYRNG